MRIPLRPFYAIAAAMAFLILPSCRKERLLLEEDPDAIGQFCRIDTFSFGGGGPNYSEQVMISYNRAGNPVIMTPSLFGGQYGELFDYIYFRYDRAERLVDCFFGGPNGPNTPFETGSIDLWHRFTYPSPHVIIDSFFNYDGPGIPPVDNPPADYSVLTVTNYVLDEKGRAIKTYIQYIAGVASFNDTTYTTYDDRGNVVIPGVTYDRKVNPYRTNKVWQLLFHDYSMNNPIYPATAYRPASTFILNFNKWGLPLEYHDNSEGDFGINLFFYNEIINLGVSYSCDQEAGKSVPD
jgi:hypothetical protein